MSAYGNLPGQIGRIRCDVSEVFYFLYLPASLAGMREVVLPNQLLPFRTIIEAVADDLGQRFIDDYVYITAKRMYVGGGVTANRPGWHADGFMSRDLNYVWYDCLPTVFNNSRFVITPDHVKSLVEFDAQALPENDVTYEPFTLLKLDQSCVHRVALTDEQMMRTFIKVSVSQDRYNLLGNSRNYGLDYNWIMHDRAKIRNDPRYAQRDTAPDDDHFK